MASNRQATYQVNALYHHGIKGMKWGVMHGPPYPLSLSKHTKVVSKSKSDGKRRNDHHSIKLTDNQKKALLVGASIGTALLASYGIYKVSQLSSSNNITSIRSIKDLTTANHVTKSPDVINKEISNTVKKTNPNKGHNNCYNCATAYILRRCGLDVQALPDTRNGKGAEFDEIVTAFGKSPSQDARTIYPDGSDTPALDKAKRGIMRQYERGKYKDGDIGVIAGDIDNHGAVPDSGHIFNFEIVNGDVIFADGQPGISGNELEMVYKTKVKTDREIQYCVLHNIEDKFSQDDLAKYSKYVK